jgi:CRISPR-associated exonuclease Cas4
MYTEDDLIPLSALQHLLFCKRQCALIHIEQTWIENVFTAEGRIMHDRVDSGGKESRGDVRIAYGLLLKSLRLGLTGKADAVEFHRRMDAGKTKPDMWMPFPVEYKRGRPKKDNCDKVQLCAQAMCLEEMLDLEIPGGALFYGKTRRRQDVVFDAALRLETENAAKELHELFESRHTPKPVYEKKCDSCSFVNLCLPKTIGSKRSANSYLNDIIQKS